MVIISVRVKEIREERQTGVFMKYVLRACVFASRLMPERRDIHREESDVLEEDEKWLNNDNEPYPNQETLHRKSMCLLPFAHQREVSTWNTSNVNMAK